MKYIFFSILILNLISCNKQEVFIDDKENWERVFKSNKPYNVTILNSYVWKASDYYEIEFYFKLKYNKDFYLNEIKNMKQRSYSNLNYSRFKHKWFAPNPGKHYKVFIHDKINDLNTILIYDTKESIIYYHDIYW